MATQRPDQVCGIHFFNPATHMRLVEVVRPITASDDTIKSAMAFATTCGKDAIEVVDRAGFVVNALLFPYLNNAVRMYEHGTASIDDIDTAMCGGCNFPMGPFALLDLVGLDTSVAILDALYDGVPRSELCAGADAASQGRRRPTRPQVWRRLLRVLMRSPATRSQRVRHAAIVAHAAAGASTPSRRTADHPVGAAVAADRRP